MIVLIIHLVLSTYSNVLISFTKVDSSGAIESSLLDQIRLVWSGQILPIWISKTICLEVQVGKLKKKNGGKKPTRYRLLRSIFLTN